MCEGVPVALSLQGLSLLIGIVAFGIPLGITVLGYYFSRQFSNRIESLAADLDEALGRIKELENAGPSGAGGCN